MIDIKIKLLDKSLPMPVYAHGTDAGIDLYSAVSCILKPYERKLIPSGIKLSIPEGYAGFVLPRSGLAIKNGISLVNSPGLIDLSLIHISDPRDGLLSRMPSSA